MTEMDKSPKRIGELFDDISPNYDLLNHLLSMSVDVGWRELALKELEIRKGDVILDVATGTGDMALKTRSSVDCTIVGIDLSRNMLKTAMQKWDARFPGGTFMALQGNALQMPFADDSFDRSMVAFGIRNMIDIGGFLDEAHRVLRPHGHMAILEFSVPPYPLVRQLYLLYLTRVLPFIGGLRSGNRGAYQYLSESIRRFPSPGSIEELLVQHHFRTVRSLPLTLGVCHLYIIEKM
ncbi:MAG: bifunctional demethylmenaquinone methyltransferase/2-methoxy-6-polyprenyl-1,4-benzoquinol methylase UbiE [Methanomassiliicoccus sp.]|nr:bifunctional demethylmenaquinone methyltransferase/2-methoxy-6-polyprenyl-1,4-benzoquinol methylase UbiE [Methanomassiliicoccus sp.]